MSPSAPLPPTFDALACARRVLADEGAALAAVAERLDARFPAAIARVLAAHGRVVVCGMGKSGLVGRKIASTLSSMGTPAFFLHPGEALHGDLGMVTPDDVVLLLSNSGETEEVVRLIPFLRRIGAGILAITGRPESTLGRGADIALDGGVAREACPLNLAPTSSTTVALALGDALAVALAEARGFAAGDFARLHPSGALGRSFITVASLMHRGDELPLIGPEQTLAAALPLMTARRFGSLLVVDGQQRLLGMVTDGDLRRHLERSGGRLDLPLAEMMTRNPCRVAPERLAMEALKVMEDRAITALPVVDDIGVLVGFLHLHDILRSRMV